MSHIMSLIPQCNVLLGNAKRLTKLTQFPKLGNNIGAVWTGWIPQEEKMFISKK